YDWIRSSGAQMFRSTGDIVDNWESICDLYKSQMEKGPYGAPGCFNDLDMLVVGMYGGGNVGRGGCSDVEYESHFALWCMFNSPLMIGCDIRNISDGALKILTNKDLIAINQDEEGRQPYFAHDEWGRHTWVKPLANNEYAIGYFNLSDNRTDALLHFWDIGLPIYSGYGLELYDCINHKTIGTFTNYYNPMLDAHQCAVYRAKLVKVK
ncbi:MAG TPA: glycoside hydrolase family 27 protein, partial [Bacillota bacterium]|nr:glycoside hydrolase family 27 protein [Bacillota bacterium]